MARIDDYKESFRLASLELGKRDPVGVAKAAGVEVLVHENRAELKVPFLGTNYLVAMSEGGGIRKENSDDEVPLPDKILIAHYLLGSKAAGAPGKLITFRQVRDGQFYFDAFQRRARDPFVAFFGGNGRLFRKCAEIMGGTPVPNGDFGMEFHVFPHVHIQLVLWEGDEEFPPDATVLFHENVQDFLSPEDIAVMSGGLVYRLIGLGRKMQ